MDLDDLIVSVYCLIDDELQDWLSGERLRQRGPNPMLSDAEVLSHTLAFLVDEQSGHSPLQLARLLD